VLENRVFRGNSRTTHLGPFGEVIRATGPLAKLNPFMFSTKFYDWESGLYCYPFRYYNPSTGRWIGRDRMEEQGGLNLYGFVGNNPISRCDPFGLDEMLNEGSLDLLLTYLGIGNSTHLAANMIADVVNGSVVTSEGDGWLAEARGKWACGSSGEFIHSDNIATFNPAPDLGLLSAVDWFFTGNWQLFLQADCRWKCSACQDCSCKCHTTCDIKGTISKTYTLVYAGPGGNKWDILTSPVAVTPVIQAFNVIQNFGTARLEIGKKKCSP